MSRAYRVRSTRVRESDRRVDHLSDSVSASLDLLPILDREEMASLLARELESRGFLREGAFVSRRRPDGVHIEVELDSAIVKLSIAEQIEVEGEITRTVRSPGEAAATQARARAQLSRQLDDRLENERAHRQPALSARLQESFRGLQPELEQVAHRVTAEALKVRAGRLGEIEQIFEGDNGDLTITVKV